MSVRVRHGALIALEQARIMKQARKRIGTLVYHEGTDAEYSVPIWSYGPFRAIDSGPDEFGQRRPDDVVGTARDEVIPRGGEG